MVEKKTTSRRITRGAPGPKAGGESPLLNWYYSGSGEGRERDVQEILRTVAGETLARFEAMGPAPHTSAVETALRALSTPIPTTASIFGRANENEQRLLRAIFREQEEPRPPAGQTMADLADAAIQDAAEGEALPPVHPGEILLEEFIRPHGLSPIRTAKLLGVPRTRIERLVTGETSMTVDTALRLEALFGASAEFWMDLQTRHDLELARQGADVELAQIKLLPIPSDAGDA